MDQKNNLIGFSFASLIVHTAVIALVLNSIDDSRLPAIGASNPQQRLQVSMNTKAQADVVKNILPQKPARPDAQHNVKPRLQAEKKPTKTEFDKRDAKLASVETTTTDTGQQLSPKVETSPNKPGSLPSERPNQSVTKTPSNVDEQEIITRNSKIQEKLNALISVHKKYPMFAVRRGWQGTVELGLRVEANGKLTRVRILKTSGYRILDEAALTMLTSASNVKGIELWLNGRYFDTTLPVEYRLTDG